MVSKHLTSIVVCNYIHSSRATVFTKLRKQELKNVTECGFQGCDTMLLEHSFEFIIESESTIYNFSWT